MLRQHALSRESVTDADSSVVEHERMTACAEEVLKRLGLPFRTVVLCTGAWASARRRLMTSKYGCRARTPIAKFPAARFVPGLPPYGALSPGRRKATRFVHTLNGSGVAVGRALIAVMENYQQEDGIHIPEALQPYMGGLN